MKKLTKYLSLMQLALLVVAVGLLLWSTPWSEGGEVRKISVSGLGTVKAVPDSYQFSPSYEETGTDTSALLASMTAKANEVTDKLMELGVAEEDIALQSSAYNQKWLDTGDDQTVSFYLTISVDEKVLSQKVQDYLLTTNPQGAISPYPTFSDDKQKELEKQAREKAIADARAKAETIAKETGVSVGKVLVVDEATYGGDIVTLEARDSSAGSSTSLPILTGKQEVTISVTVSFAIK